MSRSISSCSLRAASSSFSVGSSMLFMEPAGPTRPSFLNISVVGLPDRPVFFHQVHRDLRHFHVVPIGQPAMGLKILQRDGMRADDYRETVARLYGLLELRNVGAGRVADDKTGRDVECYGPVF